MELAAQETPLLPNEITATLPDKTPADAFERFASQHSPFVAPRPESIVVGPVKAARRMPQ